MIITRTPIEGVAIIDLELRTDDRGFFARTFCVAEFAAAGLATDVEQGNLSFNHRAGTLRGMHYQVAPHPEAKLVRCTARRDLRHHRRPAPGVADLAAARRGRAHRGQPARALRAAVLRARLPDAGRRRRGDLPGRRGLRAGRRARAALGRPGARASTGRCRSSVISAKDASWPLLADRVRLRRSSQTAGARMIIVDPALERREAEGRPIRVALVGAGFMGRGVANQIVNSAPGCGWWRSRTGPWTAPSAPTARPGVTRCAVVEDARAVDGAIAAGVAAVTDDSAPWSRPARSTRCSRPPARSSTAARHLARDRARQARGHDERRARRHGRARS